MEAGGLEMVGIVCILDECEGPVNHINPAALEDYGCRGGGGVFSAANRNYSFYHLASELCPFSLQFLTK